MELKIAKDNSVSVLPKLNMTYRYEALDLKNEEQAGFRHDHKHTPLDIELDLLGTILDAAKFQGPDPPHVDFGLNKCTRVGGNLNFECVPPTLPLRSTDQRSSG